MGVFENTNIQGIAEMIPFSTTDVSEALCYMMGKGLAYEEAVKSILENQN